MPLFSVRLNLNLIFFVAALFNLTHAVRAKMQEKDFVWDKEVRLSAALKCIDGGYWKSCKKLMWCRHSQGYIAVAAANIFKHYPKQATK